MMSESRSKITTIWSQTRKQLINVELCLSLLRRLLAVFRSAIVVSIADPENDETIHGCVRQNMRENMASLGVDLTLVNGSVTS